MKFWNWVLCHANKIYLSELKEIILCFLQLVFETEYDEFSGTNSSHSNLNNQLTIKYVLSCHGLTKAALDKKSLFGLRSGECSIAPQKRQIIFYHRANLRPGIRIIRFKHKMGRGFLRRFFNHDKETPNRDISPLAAVSIQCTGAPYQDSLSIKWSYCVD